MARLATRYRRWSRRPRRPRTSAPCDSGLQMIDASTADGSTALHVAAKHGHANVLRLLLEAGADALSADAEMRTALHLVAVAGHGLCVKALLDAGADPEGRDSDGKTPLDLAEGGRHMGCLRMMKLGQERRLASGDKAFRRAK